MNIKQLLDNEVSLRNSALELSFDKPDPLMIAKKYNDEYISLFCALFAYGKATKIVEFLYSIDFALFNESEEQIRESLRGFYYRFQNSEDIINFIIAIKRVKNLDSLQELFLQGYKDKNSVLEGIDYLIKTIYSFSDHSSQGYSFLISSPFKRDKLSYIKEVSNSPYKRWNMFLRWMVRKDHLDMGLWEKVDKKDLILPLDTHTFHISQKLGLLSRKTYDLKSALLVTQKLREFDKEDPIKYDFALYRIGQEKIDLL